MTGIVVVLGLPGVGKTRVTLALANALAQRDESVLIAHTDIMKVTAGHVGHSKVSRAAHTVRALEVQCEKAIADGYILLVEGTLAIGLEPPDGSLVVVLELDESERLRRCALKHPSARAATVVLEPTRARSLLESARGRADLLLDASQSIDALVRSCFEAMGAQRVASRCDSGFTL